MENTFTVSIQHFKGNMSGLIILILSGILASASSALSNLGYNQDKSAYQARVNQPYLGHVLLEEPVIQLEIRASRVTERWSTPNKIYKNYNV